MSIKLSESTQMMDQSLYLKLPKLDKVYAPNILVPKVHGGDWHNVSQVRPGGI